MAEIISGRDGDVDDVLQGQTQRATINLRTGEVTLLEFRDFEIRGGEGDDIIRPGLGADTALGGPGNDVFLLYRGADFARGSSEFFPDERADSVDGGEGRDRVQVAIRPNEGSMDGFVVHLGQGRADGGDRIGNVEDLWGSEGADTLTGSDLANEILGQGGQDVIEGGAGDDTLDGMADADTISGGVGNDRLGGWGGADLILGRAGDDYLHGETPSLALFDDESDTRYAPDTLRGGEGNDTLQTITGNDVMEGGRGDDVFRITTFESISPTLSLILDGGEGYDRLETLSGDNRLDRIDWEAGQIHTTRSQIITFTGLEEILGQVRPDMQPEPELECTEGTAGQDRFTPTDAAECFDGLAGTDRLLFQAAPTGVRVDLLDDGPTGEGGLAEGDVYRNIEEVTGSAHDDHLLGTGGANRFDGKGGADILVGRGGPDVLLGRGGPDDLSGGGAADILSGHGKNDTLDGGAGADILAGGAGNDSLSGGADPDNLAGGAGRDTLKGGAGADDMTGGKDRDLFLGLTSGDVARGGGDRDTVSFASHTEGVVVSPDGDVAGSWILRLAGAPNAKLRSIEEIVGSAFDDEIGGSAGNDTIKGGRGEDLLVGGPGDDALKGDRGNDAFFTVFNGNDEAKGGQGADRFEFVAPSVSLGVPNPGVFTIRDFALEGTIGERDQLVFRSILLTEEELLGRATQSGTSVSIPVGEGELRLAGLRLDAFLDAVEQFPELVTVV